MLFFIMFSVPVWINVQVVSRHPDEKFKKDREQWLGGTFELDGFRNGAPFYSDIQKRHVIHYTCCKSWHMTNSYHSREDTGVYIFRIDTHG